MAKLKLKTVIVDDESRALNRMKILLSHFPEIEVVAEVDQAEHALGILLKYQPDVVFLDIEMPGITGLELAAEINKNIMDAKIIFVTAYDHYAIPAIKEAAFDYLLKPISIDELKTTIERYKAKLHIKLSKREFEIMRLIGQGLNSKAIAEQLFLSRHTIDTYRRSILEKTDCKNSAELISYATRNHLI